MSESQYGSFRYLRGIKRLPEFPHQDSYAPLSKRSTQQSTRAVVVRNKEYLKLHPNNEYSRDAGEPNDIQLIYYPQVLEDEKRQQSSFTPFGKAMLVQSDWKDFFERGDRRKERLGQTQLNFNQHQSGLYRSRMHDADYSHNKTLFQQMMRMKSSSMPRIKVSKKAIKLDDSVEQPIYDRVGMNGITSSETNRVAVVAKKKKQVAGKGPPIITKKVYRLFLSTNSYTQPFPVSASLTELINRPAPRENCTISVLQDRVFLYGGMGRDLDPNLYELFVKDLSWKKHLSSKEPNQKIGRLGHTSNAYKKSIVVFGGERKFNKTLKIRNCLSDAFLIQPREEHIKDILLSGDAPEQRRNHATNIVGKFLIVTGGVNQHAKCLSSVQVLNLESCKWIEGDVDNFFVGEGIAFHTTFVAFNGTIKMDNFYMPYEVGKSRRKKRVHQEGLYVYGGRTNAGLNEHVLQVITFGSYPLVCSDVATQGVVPCARFMHTLNYLEEQALVVVVGGKNDMVGILAEVALLEMDTLTWCLVDCYGYEYCYVVIFLSRIGRCCHASFHLDSKIFIFGGIESTVYSTSDLVIIETDQIMAKLRIRQQALVQFYSNHCLKFTQLNSPDMTVENNNEQPIVFVDVQPPQPPAVLTKQMQLELESAARRTRLSQTVQILNFQNFKGYS